MSRQHQQQLLKEGLDAYLQRIGKDLPVGSKVRLRLVSGPQPQTHVDPVEVVIPASTSAAAAANNGNNTIPKQSFPSILKFPPSSTQPPNFNKAPWNTKQGGRLHIENVPKPAEDSDDEEGDPGKPKIATTNMNNNLGTNESGNGEVGGSSANIAASSANATKQAGKKRWRYNRNVTPIKQWTLQDQVDFLETMLYRREQVKYQKLLAQYRKRIRNNNDPSPPPPVAPVPPPIRSTRYVGIPEKMTSHHALFTLQPPSQKKRKKQQYDMDDEDDDDDDYHRNTATIVVQPLPALDQPIMVPMTQPAVRAHKAFATLSNAAQVMEDQRFAMSTTAASLAFRNARPKMHDIDSEGTDRPLRVGGIKKISTTQSRLLQKLQQKEKSSANKNFEEEVDGDDVMADVAYKERKGSGSSARRELLSSLGDGLKVSDDGVVLGGTNDALFGGRGLRFNQIQADSAGTNNNTGSTNNAEGDKMERGADGAAMADDFYTRDVGAEYEELDYDAEEQFDDDDVDVGETEMHNVGGADGYNEDEDDDEIDDDSDDMNDDDDESVGGVEGLASIKGYKALLAKARGELQATAAVTDKADESRSSSPTTTSNPNGAIPSNAANASANSASSDDDVKRSVSPKPDKSGKKGATAADGNKPIADHLAQKMSAAEKTAQALKEKQQKQQKSRDALLSVTGEAAPQVDENGLRLITLDAVRKEIWLNHGSIPINRLIKIFNATKKHGEVRQNKLKEVIKELCTMTTHPIHGRMLVLKQHYSHMT